MNRPGVVWVFSILLALSVFSSIIGFAAMLALAPILLASTLAIVDFAVEVVIAILTAILLYKFFMLKSDTIKWVHATFGLTLVWGAAMNFLFVQSLPPELRAIGGLGVFGIALYAIFWWIVANYVSKKEVDGQPLFSN